MRKKWWSELNQTYFYTDQMPVGVILNGTSQMAFAMECVASRDLSNKQTYFISVVYSPEDGQWKHLTGDEEADCDRIDNFLSGGGPYLVQFPSGETALLLTTRGKIYTKTGDEKAHNWSATSSRPIFPDWAGWPGAEVESAHTMLATTVQRPKGWEKTIGVVRLALNHDIEATSRKVKVDGRNREWKDTDQALFLGEFSDAWATVRTSVDDDNVYFLVEVSDTCMTSSDYIKLMLADPESETSDVLTVKVGADGAVSAEAAGKKITGIKTSLRSEGTLDSDGEDKGWIVEIAVPREALVIRDSQIALNAALYDASVEHEDFLSEKTSVINWIRVKGL
jgi:hypothetical protein